MYDIIFAGGGLAASLTAWRLHLDRPQLKLLIVEQGDQLGGNHTWSFFKSDLTARQFQWLAPLIRHHWDEYEVRFPNLHRHFTATYCSTNSAALHEQIINLLPEDAIRVNASITQLSSSELKLAGGEMLPARCVIDCRGPEPSDDLTLSFQKFTGRIMELARPHDLRGPVIMDATVPQDGDYRFLYTLPLTPTRVLVEDTRYSNTPSINTDADRTAITKYVADQGWQLAECIAEEHGALPIMLSGDIHAFWDRAPRLARLGLKAALFHPTTGYSLPNAIRAAEHLAACPELPANQAIWHSIRNYSVHCFNNQKFLRFLNRMLFIAAEPSKRYLVMERFYRRSPKLIERFYADRLSFIDKLRMLTGRPPVPMLAALKCLPES